MDSGDDEAQPIAGSMNKIVRKLKELGATDRSRLVPFLRHNLRLLLGSRRKDGHYIFRFDRRDVSAPPVAARLIMVGPGGAVDRAIFSQWDNLSELCDGIDRELGAGACFWGLGSSDGCVAHLLTRAGSRIRRWFVPLADGDHVIFSVVTRPDKRGESLAASLAALVSDRLGAGDSGIYLNCKIWNVPAHKSFFKAGFRRIDTRIYPPLG